MSFQTRNTRSLIAVAIWFGGLIVFAILGFWNISISEKDAENRLISDASRIAGEISSYLALPQWDFDSHSANAVLAGAFDDERIYAVKISKKNRMLAGKRRNYLWEPVTWDDEITEYSVQGMNPVKIDGQSAGSVEVWMSPRMQKEENIILLQREIWRMIICSFIWTLVLFLVLWQWRDLRRFHIFLANGGKNSQEIMHTLNQVKSFEKQEKTGNLAESSENNNSSRQITALLFRHSFCKAPELMSRLYSEENFSALCQLGKIIENSAKCLGFNKLEETAKKMQEALKDPLCETRALPVELCVTELEEVLDKLKSQQFFSEKNQEC